MAHDPAVSDAVRALVTDADGRREVATLPAAELGEGDVTVRVRWSSVNYKDGLAADPRGRVARISPLVPGIDLAGEVLDAPAGGDLRPGDAVLVHGYDLGVAHHGGYAERARVPAGWVVPLPTGLTPRDAMAIGTAGYTAALSVLALERAGLAPGDGPVLVTGASGGVGSTAVAMLAGLGHEVVAASGKDAGAWLRSLGASDVVSRETVAGDPGRPLERQRWAGAVDCVGGAILAGVLRATRHGATVAASGNTAGIDLPTTVLPFILRGVRLVGIDSVQTPLAERRGVWARLAGDLRPPGLADVIAREIGLDAVPEALDAIRAGALRGRTVVRID